MIQRYEDILAQIDAIDPTAYAKTRNRHDGAVTKLSPYISRGVISLPLVRDRLLRRHSKKDCEKLIQELAWREYFQQVWWEKGEAIFSDLRFSRDDWQHEELVTALVDGATGVTALDEAIEELFQTGYMHNHLRMSAASVACNLARAHWYQMGRWMYYHLIDGDPASNFCSWQWVAGTSVNKRYLTNQAVINACSPHSQTDTWLSFERDDMERVAIPEVLRSTTSPDLLPFLPESEVGSLAENDGAVLYTPWTLDPLFESEANAMRILVIDTDLFSRLPVSELVMNFIIEQGRAVIPDLQVFVGDPLQLIHSAKAIPQYQSHQTNQSWPGEGVECPLLFPKVTGYYPSFFKYWQKVSHAY